MKALANLDAAYANVDVARLSLLSSVAGAYIDVRYFQQRIASRSRTKSRRETLDLTKLQLQAGAASRLDVVQAEGLVNTSLAQIPGLRPSSGRHRTALQRFSACPARLWWTNWRAADRSRSRGSTSMRAFRPISFRNRPDIRAAERQLAAATANIGVAEAQLYPSISSLAAPSPRLTHALSVVPTRIESPGRFVRTQPKHLRWRSVAGKPECCRIAGARGIPCLEGQRPQRYSGSGNALAAVQRDGRTVAALRNTVKSYQEALQLATASYRDGASSLLDVLMHSVRSPTHKQALHRRSSNRLRTMWRSTWHWAAVTPGARRRRRA